MVGIPPSFLVFIWVPTLVSVAAVVHELERHRRPRRGSTSSGSRTTDLFTTYPPFWPAVPTTSSGWLVFLFIATPLGIFFAVLLDQEIRGTRIYQSALLPAGRPVAGDRRVHLAAAVRARQGSSTASSAVTSQDNVDRLARATRSLNLWAVLVAASWRHVGYVMVLYLAGLKSVDPTLREAAKIDGATERQTFFRVVLPGHARRSTS